MTDASFPKCYPWVRESEGGNDDDPDDPGGRTSRGITQREFDVFCKSCGTMQGDVWKATEDQIRDIYQTSYWEPWSTKLPPGVDYVFFDEAVNSGMHEAALVLQRAAGVTADGHIGLITMAAVASIKPADLIGKMSAERMNVYNEIIKAKPVLKKYIKGWRARVAFCKGKALTLV